ncbi:MAG: DUF4278 domain-containing protein [Elainella sp. Prado103]|jgi:hypothetical protein|nr:DUF4278 domain-containing protein [Elainella sp. Prado103]
MQLTYRGHSYLVDHSSVDMAESGITGTYRGHAFPVTYPRHIPVAQPVRHLSYRGVRYQTTSGGGVKTTAPQPALRSSQTPRLIKPSSYNNVHQLHIRQRLQQRMEAAKAKGDQKLLSLLEQELQQAG